MKHIVILTLLINISLLFSFLYEFHMGKVEILGPIDVNFWYIIYIFIISLFIQFLFIFDILKNQVVRFFVKIFAFFINVIGSGSAAFVLRSIYLNQLDFKDIVFESPLFKIRRLYSKQEYLDAMHFFYEKHTGLHLYQKLTPYDFEILCQSKSMMELEWKIEYHIQHPVVPFVTKIHDFVWSYLEPVFKFIATNPEKIKECFYDLCLTHGSGIGILLFSMYLIPTVYEFVRIQRHVRTLIAFFANFEQQHAEQAINVDSDSDSDLELSAVPLPVLSYFPDLVMRVLMEMEHERQAAVARNLDAYFERQNRGSFFSFFQWWGGRNN